MTAGESERGLTTKTSQGWVKIQRR
jgi:hypothetical protein